MVGELPLPFDTDRLMGDPISHITSAIMQDTELCGLTPCFQTQFVYFETVTLSSIPDVPTTIP